MQVLTYSFNERKEEPLYEYLYKEIKHDIEQGIIAPGEKLPSKRAFSRHLGVSLITVEGAYTQLIAEGYVISKERKGYYANSVLPEPTLTTQRHRQNSFKPFLKNKFQGALSRESKSEKREEKPSYFADLTGSEVARGRFPYGSWSKSIRDALSCESEQVLIGNSDTAGSRRLREVLANYLYSFRGMEVDPECIVIGAGSQILDNMIIQLLGQMHTYGIENPGYPRLQQLYRANRVNLVCLPLDDKGVVTEALYGSDVSVMHVMPSHQFPTGLITPISRRYELLAWASEGDRYLIEDDFDSEFRLTGRPIPSLQSIDKQGRVIYTNTFSKTLGPAFRLGYMVLPHALKERFDKTLSFYSCTVSAVDQLALARFIEQGDYERHVNRMRNYYRALRNKLISELMKSSFSSRISLYSQDSGIHFVMHVETKEQEQRLALELQKRGVNIVSLSEFYLDATMAKNKETSSGRARFLMSYSGLSEEAIPKVISVMEEVFK